MASYTLVVDSPAGTDVLDVDDSRCGYPDYCGGCDRCICMQITHWGGEVKPLHYVPTREEAERGLRR